MKAELSEDRDGKWIQIAVVTAVNVPDITKPAERLRGEAIQAQADAGYTGVKKRVRQHCKGRATSGWRGENERNRKRSPNLGWLFKRAPSVNNLNSNQEFANDALSSVSRKAAPPGARHLEPARSIWEF